MTICPRMFESVKWIGLQERIVQKELQCPEDTCNFLFQGRWFKEEPATESERRTAIVGGLCGLNLNCLSQTHSWGGVLSWVAKEPSGSWWIMDSRAGHWGVFDGQSWPLVVVYFLYFLLRVMWAVSTSHCSATPPTAGLKSEPLSKTDLTSCFCLVFWLPWCRRKRIGKSGSTLGQCC